MIVQHQEQLGDIEESVKAGIDKLEKSIGNSGEEEAVKTFGKPLPANSPLTQYVVAVGNDLVPQIRSSRADFGYNFNVLQSDVINAFALPNGSIYVTTALLSRLKSEQELANLLGHEITHVTEHHGVQQLGIDFGTIGGLLLAQRAMEGKMDEEDAALGAALLQSLISNGYSRDQEDESDELGQKLAYTSGYDAQGMVDLMNQFLALEKEKPNDVEMLFRSHPWSGERVENARARMLNLQGTPRKKSTTSVKHISYKKVAQNAATVSSTGSITGPLVAVGAAFSLLALALYLR